jgi:ABC-type sugar transport system substrate-binding protein
VAASQSGQWDRLVALDVTTNMLRANPDIMAIYCNNDTMVLGALKAAANLGYKVLNSANVDSEAGKPKTIIIIGNDGIAEALQAVQAGNLTGTIAQKPFLMGYSALEAALQALGGQPTSPATTTPIKLLVQSDFSAM